MSKQKAEAKDPNFQETFGTHSNVKFHATAVDQPAGAGASIFDYQHK